MSNRPCVCIYMLGHPLVRSDGLEVLLPVLVLVRLGPTVQWCPLGLVLEQAHSLCVLRAWPAKVSI